MNKTTYYQGKLVSYSIQGNGPDLVFLHGFLEYKEVWLPFIHHFTDRYRVLCIDLPGHGDSEVLKSVHSMKEMAQVVKFVMDENNMPKAVLIGHSMGGYVALNFVYYFNSNCSGLVMFSSSALNDSTEKLLARNRDLDFIMSDKKDLVINNSVPNMFAPSNLVQFKHEIEAIKERAKQMPERGMTAAIKGMMSRVNNVNYLKNLTLPTLFIAGLHDHLIQIDVSQRQVENAKNISFKVLENSGHMGYIEEEAISAQYLQAYLDELK